MKTKKRGRPARKMPDRIDAPPELVAEALFYKNDSRFKKQTKQH